MTGRLQASYGLVVVSWGVASRCLPQRAREDIFQRRGKHDQPYAQWTAERCPRPCSSRRRSTELCNAATGEGKSNG